MRADRLLSLAYLLKARGMVTATELARLLEVSPRTILRDVEALSASGVPVYCQPGRRGGVALLPGYRTDVSALSEQEAVAIFAAITAPGADALGFGEALTSALRKLMAAVPDAHRPSAARLAERVVIDTGGWLPRREEPLLALAQEAVLGDQRVRIRYQGRSDASASMRTVDPYGLLHTGGVWYLVAAHRGRVRFYRLARVTHLRLLDEPSNRPAGIDLRQLWAERREGFRSAFTPVDAELWVRRRRLGDLAGHAAGQVTLIQDPGWLRPRAAAERASPPDDAPDSSPGNPVPDGSDWVAVHVPFGDLRHAWHVVRDLDDDVVAVTPAELRHRVVERARAVLCAYEDRNAGGAGHRAGRFSPLAGAVRASSTAWGDAPRRTVTR